MFQSLLGTVSENISTIRLIIQTNEKLREIVTSDDLDESKKAIISELIQDFPNLTYWKVYDHCAVVTRLYAIYERFVESLISDWLQFLPDILPAYSDLDDCIRTSHRSGVGKLLCDLDKQRFKHLTPEEVIRGLFHGITGEAQYRLLPDAFLLHEQNLWKKILEQLLNSVGIPNSWNWVEKHRLIEYFIEEVRASENTAEGELQLFISYRNDAAHGTPVDTTIRANSLLQLCDFVDNLCRALAELVSYHIIMRKDAFGQAKSVGRITRWFAEPQAARAKVRETTLSPTTPVFLINEETSLCYLAKIEGLMVEDSSGLWVPTDEITTAEELEIGIKFDIEVRRGIQMYVQS